MSRLQLTSVVCGMGESFVDEKNPSWLIPFRGNLPLLPSYRVAYYQKMCLSVPYVSELPQEFQDIAWKAYEIATMHENFRKYLQEYGIDQNEFAGLSEEEKADKLADWMEKSNIDISRLTIE